MTIGLKSFWNRKKTFDNDRGLKTGIEMENILT